jgi:hypothetical protein
MWPTKVDAPACQATGRPALTAVGVEFDVVANIDPAKKVKWANPDGDGLYSVTVTNPTDAPLTVPALLQRDGRIRWEQSLLVFSSSQSYRGPTLAVALADAAPAGPLSPVVLEPGESVSTVVNVLHIDGLRWPRGGSRVNLLFALGEQGVTNSFYYLARHHDGLRN